MAGLLKEPLAPAAPQRDPRGLGTVSTTVVELPYPPSVNKLHTRTRGGQVVLRAAVREWRRSAGWAYKAAGGKQLEGRVAIEMELYKPEGKVPFDVDNGIKVTLDCLKGVAYRDDDQVVLLSVAKLWPDGRGRMVLRVKKVSPG